MVQALAFAEIFAGGILMLCGYKGYSPSEVVKGEAGAARSLSSGASSTTTAGSEGGATNTAGASHGPSGMNNPSFGATGSGGFTAGSGTNYSVGKTPEIAKALNALGTAMHLHLTGISGYRTPQHSVAVGGFANDPHTKGEASDTQGAQGIAKAILNKFGLERPFPGAAEADHIQLLHSVNANGGY